MDSLNQRFSYFRAGLQEAPETLYLRERKLSEVMGDAMDNLLVAANALGLYPCNSDGAHHVEATIYEWLTKGDRTVGATLEGIGQYGYRVHNTSFSKRG